ncbi:MAG: hypothetical protein HY366_01000 [Candidatus Aenigmarchaeota archaeon]|nr:hypothetical protein [Candidatus Aenigmarchaeota archaeon]
MANFIERWLGFKVSWRKIAAVIVAIAVVFIFFTVPSTTQPKPGEPTNTAGQQRFDRQEEQFLQKVEGGGIEPVLTQDINVTSTGFQPQFALIRYTPEIGQARVRIINMDSKTRNIVLGDNDVREMTPGYRFTMTFGAPIEIEIWDRDTPSIRGKIFVR